MVRLLPPRPSLEHLKQQAKDLIGAYRRGEPEAQARLWRLFPPPGPLAALLPGAPAPSLRYCPTTRSTPPGASSPNG
ncbi:MAG TPA: hypothetical protein VHQ00_05150, partial [Chloroflexota bacterium]|nr:hypothetical protein [Chloroflexota bacterium]